MSRIDHQAVFETSYPIDVLTRKIKQFCALNQIKIERESNNCLEARQGSQLVTRFLGGWFVNPAQFPKKIVFTLSSPQPDKNQVMLTFNEDLGFGFLDSKFKERYRDGFTNITLDFDAFLSDSNEDEQPRPAPDPLEKPALTPKFTRLICPACGDKIVRRADTKIWTCESCKNEYLRE